MKARSEVALLIAAIVVMAISWLIGQLWNTPRLTHYSFGQSGQDILGSNDPNATESGEPMAASGKSGRGVRARPPTARPSSAKSSPRIEPPVQRLFDLRLAMEDAAPVYQQLVDQLRLLVNTGELAAGSRLPSARHLAANLRINRNTALKAYLVLAREGVSELHRHL